jgi:hypothetical protein
VKSLQRRIDQRERFSVAPWRPIATAPKDHMIMVWAQDRGSGWHGWLIVQWIEGDIGPGFYLTGRYLDDDPAMVTDGDNGDLTHWMPLPIPPTWKTQP